MYRNATSLLFCVLGLTNSQKVEALPKECIQAETRVQSCPRLIYKQAAVAVPVLGVEKNGVICICLTDFEQVKSAQMSKLEQIDRQVTLQRVARKYQISEEELIKLIKH
ncbi:hypothetical protein [Paraglaciecola sp.]|uniref:hypothetical protein n=1 Tax=Paraglaciecola sp. TaxID=1920173 RepID=UPI003EF41096